MSFGSGSYGESPFAAAGGKTEPPEPTLVFARFVKGMRSRHRSRVISNDGALFHTGQVGAPPEVSVPKRFGEVVLGMRSRHRSRVIVTRNFHTGLDNPPNVGLIGPAFTKGMRARHRSRVVITEPFHVSPTVLLHESEFVKGTRSRHRSRIMLGRPHLIDWARRSTQLRGLYRVFGDAEYLFFRTLGSPPLESDTPFASNATLPFEPVDLFADGEWYLSLMFTNGVIRSGFLPVGPNGETYVRLSLVGGTEAGAPPQAPATFTLELRAGGVVRVLALYDEAAALRADDYVINATFDGSTPGEDPLAPTAEIAIAPSGLEFLAEDLPAQVDGTTVTVRLQTRRTDTGPVDVWSEGSTATIQVATADDLGPTTPTGGTVWRGSLPAEEG